jgi:hypothetical protein
MHCLVLSFIEKNMMVLELNICFLNLHFRDLNVMYWWRAVGNNGHNLIGNYIISCFLHSLKRAFHEIFCRLC